MSDASSLLRSEKIQRVLRVLKDTGVENIEPKVEFGSGVRYPLFDGLGIPVSEVGELLSTLREAGILSSEIVDNVVVCPRCRSHRLMTRSRCPSCSSPRLIVGRMIEHLACGHIDFEERFESAEGLFCPNCRKPLGQIGLDYRVFSSLYKCLECKSAFSDPNIEYICDNGHAFGEKDLTIQNIIAFRVVPEKRVLIERLTFDIRVLLKPLIDEGLLIMSPASFYGKSGVKHEFSFAVGYSSDLPPVLVGSVHVSDRAASSADVLAFWAKATDVGVKHKVMVVLGGIDEGGRSLAEAYGMKIIEGGGIEDLSTKLKDYVVKVIEEGLKEG